MVARPSSESATSAQREKLAVELLRPDTALGAHFLAALVEVGAEHPRLRLDPARFAEHVARVAPPAALGGEGLLEQLCLSDLFLAHACARGEPLALSIFEQRYLRPLRSLVDSIDACAARLDELKQLLRERLLFATRPELPRIARYAGRGPLRAWVQTAARRLALSSLRRRRRRPLLPEELALGRLAPHRDPELSYLRLRYADELRAAFEAALKDLGPHERLLLRLQLVDGVSLQHIAAIYKVSQSTISRRLERARQTMGQRMLEELQALLGADPAELESLVRAAHSRFEFNLSSALRPDLPPEELPD